MEQTQSTQIMMVFFLAEQQGNIMTSLWHRKPLIWWHWFAWSFMMAHLEWQTKMLLGFFCFSNRQRCGYKWVTEKTSSTKCCAPLDAENGADASITFDRTYPRRTVTHCIVLTRQVVSVGEEVEAGTVTPLCRTESSLCAEMPLHFITTSIQRQSPTRSHCKNIQGYVPTSSVGAGQLHNKSAPWLVLYCVLLLNPL